MAAEHPQQVGRGEDRGVERRRDEVDHEAPGLSRGDLAPVAGVEHRCGPAPRRDAGRAEAQRVQEQAERGWHRRHGTSVEWAEDVERRGRPAQHPLAPAAHAHQLGDDADREPAREVPDDVEPVAAAKPGDDALRVRLDAVADLLECRWAELFAQDPALAVVQLSVAEQRRAAAQAVREAVGGHAVAADEGLGIAQRSSHVVEAADRVHAVAGEPYDGAGMPDPGERVAGVGEDIVCVEVDLEVGSGPSRDPDRFVSHT